MMRAYEESFLAPRFANIPDGLKTLRWAVWTAEPRTNKLDKFDKAPRSPTTSRKIGTDKPHLFGTYDQAVATYEAGECTGVGVLLTGDGLIGVDIDDIKKTIADQPAVAKWIVSALAADAYCEVSPSNTGLRLFMLGDPLPGTVKRKHGTLEIYDNVRFLTVTGHLVKPGNRHA